MMGRMKPQTFHKNSIFVLSLLAGVGIAAGQSQPMIDNDQVRVSKAIDQAHKKGQPHEHKLDRVMVYLTAGEQHITTMKDGKTTIVKYKAGDVRWSPPTGVHAGEVTSNDDVTIIEVEIKKPGDPAKSAVPALDPVKVDPKEYSVEFENSQVRVMRIKIGAHQTTPLHEHARNRVVVYLTDQNFKITSADGKVETPQHKAGEASWGGPAKHKEENLNDKPFEVVVVELKS
jgi:quercetin dioxygenase-like cupin family protein